MIIDEEKGLIVELKQARSKSTPLVEWIQKHWQTAESLSQRQAFVRNGPFVFYIFFVSLSAE